MSGSVRVLQIITRLIVGGAQETAMLTADVLGRSGWAVDVLCGPQTGPEGSLIEAVRGRGVRLTIERSLVREIHPVRDVVALARLIRFIRCGQYTVVHTNSSKAGILGRWAAWLAGVPIIVHTVHGWGHHERQHPLMRRTLVLVERLSARITDKLIVVSPLNTEKGLADGIGSLDKYVTIRSGIELDRFLHPPRTGEEMRAELGIPVGAPVVGTVARFSPQKAPLDFCRAMGAVAGAVPEAHFVYVGDGPLRAQCEAAIAAGGLGERFHLTGLRRDVPDLLTAFDVFALSSLWEGLPRVLPQAMAAGLPIVATAVDGNVEAVQDGVNGLLVPPADPAALASAVIELLRHPERAAQLAQAGRSGVQEYSAAKTVEQIAALYEELLVEKGLQR